MLHSFHLGKYKIYNIGSILFHSIAHIKGKLFCKNLQNLIGRFTFFQPFSKQWKNAKEDLLWVWACPAQIFLACPKHVLQEATCYVSEHIQIKYSMHAQNIFWKGKMSLSEGSILYVPWYTCRDHIWLLPFKDPHAFEK